MAREVPLAEALRRLARGASLDKVAGALDLPVRDVTAALEGLADALAPPSGKGAPRPGPASQAVLRSDGAARGNPGPASTGWVIETGGETLLEGGRFLGRATNNVAEYEAVLDAARAARQLGLRDLRICLDSELVVRQLSGAYRVRNAVLAEKHAALRTLLSTFDRVSVEHVPRKENRRADEMANRVLDDVLKTPPAGAGKRKDAESPE